MVENKTKYRHELKYVVSDGQIALLKSRVAPLMQLDPSMITTIDVFMRMKMELTQEKNFGSVSTITLPTESSWNASEKNEVKPIKRHARLH